MKKDAVKLEKDMEFLMKELHKEWDRTGAVKASVSIMGRDPVEHAKRAKYKPPAMRVRGVCYTKKSPFRYNEVVQADL